MLLKLSRFFSELNWQLGMLRLKWSLWLIKRDADARLRRVQRRQKGEC